MQENTRQLELEVINLKKRLFLLKKSIKLKESKIKSLSDRIKYKLDPTIIILTEENRDLQRVNVELNNSIDEMEYFEISRNKEIDELQYLLESLRIDNEELHLIMEKIYDTANGSIIYANNSINAIKEFVEESKSNNPKFNKDYYLGNISIIINDMEELLNGFIRIVNIEKTVNM